MSDKIQIVLVDDHPLFRAGVAYTLTAEPDMEVAGQGASAAEAVQLAQELLPDLILLDLNMPGKDGREILREIKADNRFHHIPTIVFTTSSSVRDKQMVYDLGANCFITKPDTFNKLIEMTTSISKLWLQ